MWKPGHKRVLQLCRGTEGWGRAGHTAGPGAPRRYKLRLLELRTRSEGWGYLQTPKDPDEPLLGHRQGAGPQRHGEEGHTGRAREDQGRVGVARRTWPPGDNARGATSTVLRCHGVATESWDLGGQETLGGDSSMGHSSLCWRWWRAALGPTDPHITRPDPGQPTPASLWPQPKLALAVLRLRDWQRGGPEPGLVYCRHKHKEAEVPDTASPPRGENEARAQLSTCFNHKLGSSATSFTSDQRWPPQILA